MNELIDTLIWLFGMHSDEGLSPGPAFNSPSCAVVQQQAAEMLGLHQLDYRPAFMQSP